MGKKKKILPPRHKRLKRTGRLIVAKDWIEKYAGKNLIRGYCNHFAVDITCAAIELETLGYSVDHEYGKQVKLSQEVQNRALMIRRQLREQENQHMSYSDSDENFYYIAGYTSNGVPFGIRWDEVDENGDLIEIENLKNYESHKENPEEIEDKEYIDFDDLPF
jgi:hypothetical protein